MSCVDRVVFVVSREHAASLLDADFLLVKGCDFHNVIHFKKSVGFNKEGRIYESVYKRLETIQSIAPVLLKDSRS